MPTKSTKSDWSTLRKDLEQAAQTVRDYSDGLSLLGGNTATQERIRVNAAQAYQSLEVASMSVANVIAAFDGAKPFAGQPAGQV